MNKKIGFILTEYLRKKCNSLHSKLPMTESDWPLREKRKRMKKIKCTLTTGGDLTGYRVGSVGSTPTETTTIGDSAGKLATATAASSSGASTSRSDGNKSAQKGHRGGQKWGSQWGGSSNQCRSHWSHHGDGLHCSGHRCFNVLLQRVLVGESKLCLVY